jgi:hypothetical protein
MVETMPGAADELPRLLALPLCAYAGERRVMDEKALRSLLAAATRPRTLGELEEVLRGQGVARGQARATLAWLLKYGLLRTAVP